MERIHEELTRIACGRTRTGREFYCPLRVCYVSVSAITLLWGAQWLSGIVLDSRPKGRRFEPHRRHCVVVLEQDTFIVA